MAIEPHSVVRTRQIGPCSVDGCEQPARKRGWCASHYSQTRRTGRPPEPFKRKWAAEKRCVICGATDFKGKGRKYCGSRCQQIGHRGSTQQSQCAHCDALIDCSVGAGRKRRNDSKKCVRCERLRHLRAVQAGFLTIRQVLALGDDCRLCGEPVDWDAPSLSARRPSIDHIVPTAMGGGDEKTNLQLVHATCNKRKNKGQVEKASQNFYSLRSWRRLAASVRTEEPNCRRCGAHSTQTDHIVGIADGGAIWDRANLQALCRPCHLRKSGREYRARCEALI